MAIMRMMVKSRSNYTPAVYGTTETTKFWAVAAGDVVQAAFMRVRTAFDGAPTAVIGDSGSTNRFMTTTDTGITTAGLKIGTGAGFGTTPGYLYTSATTVDIVYTTSGSPTVGALDAWIYWFKSDPH